MRSRFGADVTFVERDLFGLVDAERTAALDALTRGDALPFAILDGEVISAGVLDAEILWGAIESRFSTD